MDEIYNTIDDIEKSMNNDPEEEMRCYVVNSRGDVNAPCLPPRPKERQYIELALVPIRKSEGIQDGDATPIANKTDENIPDAITAIDIHSASICPVITNPPISDVSFFDKSTERLSISSERKPSVRTKNQAMQIEEQKNIKISAAYSVTDCDGIDDEHMYFPFVQGPKWEADVAKQDSGELDHENNMAPLKNLMDKIDLTEPENCDTTPSVGCQRIGRENLLSEPNTDPSRASLHNRYSRQVERIEDDEYLIPTHIEYVDGSSPANTSESDENLLSLPLSTNDKTVDDNGGVENSAISLSTPVLCNLPSSFGYLDLDGSQVNVDDINDLRRYDNSEKLQQAEDDNEYITPIDVDMDCLPLAQGYHEWDGSKIE